MIETFKKIKKFQDIVQKHLIEITKLQNTKLQNANIDYGYFSFNYGVDTVSAYYVSLTGIDIIKVDIPYEVCDDLSNIELFLRSEFLREEVRIKEQLLRQENVKREKIKLKLEETKKELDAINYRIANIAHW